MTTILDPSTVPATAPAAGPAVSRPRQPERPVTASGVLRSEWVKLRSVRSSTMSLVAAAGTMLFIGAVSAAFAGGLLVDPDGEGGGSPGAEDPTSVALAGVLLAPLIIGILGVMSMTSEYSTGTIRTTFTVVPKRLSVLWSKAAVLTAVTLPAMAVATLATFGVGQALLGAGTSAATAGLGDPGVLRALLGTAAYLTAVALIGLAFGALLRATSAALSALFALVFLLPGLGGFLLPSSVGDDVLPYLPSNAATAFTSVASGPDMLGPGTGAVVLAAWVVVPLLAAAVALQRRPV